MYKRQRNHQQRGFTLIEMIGVLAVIGVLAALILPKVFAVVADSRVTGLVSAVKAYETGITKYYADLGTVLPLDALGVPGVEATGDSATAVSLAARLTLSSADALVTGNGMWPKFRGPYLEKFDTNQTPGLGAKMYIPSEAVVSYGTAVTATNAAFALKGDTGNSDIPTGSSVAYFKVTALSAEDFQALDGIVDKDIGTTATEKELRGRAKYDTATTTALIYLASR